MPSANAYGWADFDLALDVIQQNKESDTRYESPHETNTERPAHPLNPLGATRTNSTLVLTRRKKFQALLRASDGLLPGQMTRHRSGEFVLRNGELVYACIYRNIFYLSQMLTPSARVSPGWSSRPAPSCWREVEELDQREDHVFPSVTWLAILAPNASTFRARQMDETLHREMKKTEAAPRERLPAGSTFFVRPWR